MAFPKSGAGFLLYVEVIMTLAKLATVEEALEQSVSLTGLWYNVYFRRSKSPKKGFVLLNIHVSFLQLVCAKLFWHGCKLLSDPLFDASESFVCLHFSASNKVAGILALTFPCTAKEDQLIVSDKGILLTGIAAKIARDPYYQGIAD